MPKTDGLTLPKKHTDFLDGLTIPKILRAVNYRRVSHVGARGAEGQPEFMSPELQADPFPAVCQMRGWEPNEELSAACTDLDESAYNKHWSKRPGINRLLKAARAGQFQVLVVLTVSRLARRIKDFLEIVEAFRAAGCEVFFVREGIDTSSAFGRAMLSILAVFAELEAHGLSEWATAAARRQRLAGKPHGMHPAWIYRDDAGKLAVDDAMAESLRRLVALRMPPHNLPMLQIAAKLNQEGRKTKRGKLWTTAQIGMYLDDDNLLRMGGTAIAGELSRSGERTLLPGAYPPIFTPEELAVIQLHQRRLNNEATAARPYLVRKGRGKSLATEYLLSGLCVCGCCGGRMASGTTSTGPKQRAKEGKAGTVRSYYCHQSRVDPARHSGHRPYVLAEALEDAVVRVIRTIVTMPPEPEPMPVARKQKRKSAALDPPPQPVRTAQAVEEEMRRVALAFARGQMLEAVYADIYEELRAERENLLSQEAESLMPGAIAAALSVVQQIEGEGRSSDEISGAGRAAILLLVERVEFPVYRPDLAKEAAAHYIYDRGVKMRYARVHLHKGVSRVAVWDAPIYTARFTGECKVFPAPPSVAAQEPS